MNTSRIKLGGRVFSAVAILSTLAIGISIVGFLGIRSTQRSMESSTAAVVSTLKDEKSEVERAAELSGRIVAIDRAASTNDLPSLTGAGASGDGATTTMLALHERRRAQLELENQIDATDQRIAEELRSLSSQVDTIVQDSETEAQQRLAESLKNLSRTAATQTTNAGSALKIVSSRAESSLQSVTAILEIRAAAFQAATHLSELRYAQDDDVSRRLTGRMATAFGNMTDRLGVLPKERADTIRSELGTLQALAEGIPAIKAKAAATLPAPPPKPTPPPAPAPVAPQPSTNSPPPAIAPAAAPSPVPAPPPGAGTPATVGPTAPLSTPTPVAVNSPGPATTQPATVAAPAIAVSPPASNAPPAEAKQPATTATPPAKPVEPDRPPPPVIDPALVAIYAKVDASLGRLNRDLLTFVDDTVSDATIQTRDAVAGLEHAVGSGSGYFVTTSQAALESMQLANRRIKASLRTQAGCAKIAELVKSLKARRSATEITAGRNDLRQCFSETRNSLRDLAPAAATKLVVALDAAELSSLGDSGIAAKHVHALELADAYRKTLAEAQRMLSESDRRRVAKTRGAMTGLNSELRRSVEVAASSSRVVWILGVVVVVVSIATAWLIPIGIVRPLKSILARQRRSAQDVLSASEQIRTTNQQVAEAAEHQAAALAQTADSLKEVASMTHANAESARKAEGFSSDARTAAEQGALGMKDMTCAMNEIQTSSQGIAKILRTINEIALQTNLLALNAAVEAARAGKSGLGFAVVAEEVRNLAQRSATAARETAQRIDEASAKSARGVQISTQVARHLEQIVARNQRVDELVKQIARASETQSSGIDRIKQVISEMDAATQQNATHANETSLAADELGAEARLLEGLVGELQSLVGATSAQSVPGSRRPPISTPRARAQGATSHPADQASHDRTHQSLSWASPRVGK